MKIVDIKVMRGPNYWARNYSQLIVLKLDISEHLPSKQAVTFEKALERLLPSFTSKSCTVGVENGNLECSKESPILPQIVARVALELQCLSGMDCEFMETRATNTKGWYHVIFSYKIERAGVYAAKAAVDLVNNLLGDLDYNIDDDIKELQRLYNSEKLGPSSYSIVKEAERRNIPFTRLNKDSLIMLGQGCNQKIICASVAGTTSSIGVNMASDKDITSTFLHKAHIPVPKGTLITNLEHLEEAVNEIGFPLVTKPVNGNHGRGITTRINTLEQARIGFLEAQKVSDYVIVEKHITGNDYRFLVINFKLIAVAKRTPAMVLGDDTSTINELVDEINKDNNRGEGHEKALTKINLDAGSESILKKNNLTPNSVLPTGEILYLKDTANLSTGGTAKDVTDIVHPANVFMVERIARLMNLDICGIDIMAPDVNVPITKENGAVLEVNSGPGFRMHLSPDEGKSINVAEPLIDMLFPAHKSARIPVVAVTGTNGKTTITRLIAHMAQEAGLHTGYTITDGIFIDGNNISLGDCSGPESAASILRDPIVEYAVLETARGGILRSGLGFDKCDISIVTNITDDHLGLNDINTLEQLAKVKAVVPQSTFEHGYAILNADDDLVYEMKNNLDCNIALFSLEANNPRIIEHCKNGGWAAYIENNCFVIRKGESKTSIAEVTKVPLTFSGKCEFMIKNILPALLTASLSNFPMESIKSSLKSFIPSPELTPGRMNMFHFKDFRVLVDYAHNTDGYIHMKKYMALENASIKTGIIAAPGDRREEDIKNIGRYSAEMFDKIIIRHDRDNRGRTKEEITGLLTYGIQEVSLTASITEVSDEIESIKYAIKNAQVGELIFVCAEYIESTLAFIQQQINLEKNSLDLVPATSNQPLL